METLEIKNLEFLIWPLTPIVFMFYHVDFFLGQLNNEKIWAFFTHRFFVYFIVREAFNRK